MRTDYTCLSFVLADLELNRELGGFLTSTRVEEAIMTILEYLLEKDKPKRELILMKKTAPAKKALKPKSKMKAIKKEVKKSLKPHGKVKTLMASKSSSKKKTASRY
jgi:hypothetical protein